MSGLLAAVVILVPLALAITFPLVGLQHGWSRWPWLVGAGFAVVPAAYLTLQSTCRHVGGTCPRPSELHSSHLAAIALVVILAGMVVAAMQALGRTALVFAVLVGLGELWMVDRLAVAHQSFAAELMAVLLLAGLAVEAHAALRGGSRRF